MNSTYEPDSEFTEIETPIIGEYSLSFGGANPEGGASLIIQEHNRYAMIWFGGGIVGTWKIVKGKYLDLNPDKSEYPFYVYGRNNPDIGDVTQIYFDGDFSFNTLIHFGKIDKSEACLTPIFNEDANCKTYLAEVENKYNELSLAFHQTGEGEAYEDPVIYTYEITNAFNELVVCEYIQTFYSKPIRVVIDEDQLIFGKDKIARREALDGSGIEEIKLLEEMLTVANVPEDVYFSPDFEESRRISADSVVFFDTKLNSYVSLKKDPEDGSFYDMLGVNKYDRLQNVSFQKRQFKINSHSLIYSTCDR